MSFNREVISPIICCGKFKNDKINFFDFNSL